MDIDHLGKDIVKRFIAEGIVTHVTDIYQLDYNHIGQLEGWKERSIKNLKNGIDASKENPSWRLLVALGIRHVGTVTAKHMARQVKSILDYKDWDLERLMGMEDVGPKVAESIHEFFQNQENIQTIHKLHQLGVNIELSASEELPKDGKLSGKTFLFTGSLTRFTRDEAKDLVEKNGGQLLSGVSKNLNYLVVGADAGSKLDKAQKLGTVGILSEDEFLEMLN
jgi:DNA ligase (NAD+)